MTGPVITMKRFAIGLAAVAVVLLAFAVHRVTARDHERAARNVRLAEREAAALAERMAEVDRRMQELQDRLARPPVPALPARPIGADDDIDRATIDRLRLYDGPARGVATAHVTVVIFVDMQCPYCKKTIDALETLQTEYPGQIRILPKQYPVRGGSDVHAEMMYSTTSDDAYWRLFDLLYQDQIPRDRAALQDLANVADNDMVEFNLNLSQRRFQPKLDADRAAADALTVRATPVYFINGKRFSGAKPIEELRDLIDLALGSPAP